MKKVNETLKVCVAYVIPLTVFTRELCGLVGQRRHSQIISRPIHNI